MICETESGCQEIISHRINASGYGIIKVGKKQILAHRYSYECNFSLIPEGMCVLHKCDNPKCINPDHLFLGTHSDNTSDMKEKDRRKNISSYTKLTEQEVREIKSDTSNSQRYLAQKYGVSKSQIGSIKRGESRVSAKGGNIRDFDS